MVVPYDTNINRRISIKVQYRYGHEVMEYKYL